MTMSEQDYLLKFDLSEFTQQLDSVRGSYEDLGSIVRQVFDTSSVAVKELTKNIDTLATSINSASAIMDSTYSVLNGHMKESATILADIEKAGKGLGSLSLSGVGATSTTEGQIKDIYPGMAEGGAGTEEAVKSAVLATEAMGVADKALKGVGDAKKEIKEEISGIGKLVRKELEGAKKATGGMLSKLTGGVSFGTGLIGGLVGAMILGVHYNQRLAAESGEVANVFESSIDGLGNKATQAAVKQLSAFQEKAQKFFGIGRKEVQSQAAAFVDMGYKTEQFMGRFGKSLGEVGADLPTMTLALEKHLNLAGGSAAKNVNDMVSEYGDNVKEAAGKFLNLAFAAQQSGMGVEKFINSVMSGSQAMRQYGIDVNDVSQVMQKLQGYYNTMLGSDKSQFAGGLAGEALGSVAGGMGRMTQGFEMAIAQEMNPELQGYEAKQKFKSGLRRVAEGEDEGFFIEYIKKAVDFARRQTGGNVPAMIEFLKQNAGWDEQHSKALIDIAPTLKEDMKIEEGTAKQLAEFKKTFETEGKVLTDLQKNQESLIKGMAKIGEGLLGLVGSVLGAIVTLINSVPLLIEAISASPERRDEIFDTISKTFEIQGNLTLASIDKIIAGGGMMSEALKSILGDTSEAVKAAMAMNSPDTEMPTPGKIVDALSVGAGKALDTGVGAAFGEDAGKGFELFHKEMNDSLRYLGNSIDEKIEENVRKPIEKTIEESRKPFGGRDPFEGVTPQPVGGVPLAHNVEAIIPGRDVYSAYNSFQASQA